MDLIEKGVSDSRHPWELARLEVVRDIAEKYISDFDKKNILDLGCGDLFFIENFAQDKFQTSFYAVDRAFDNRFIEKNSRNNIHLFKTLEDISETDLVFDLIFLMDVIEHIEYDFDFLSQLVNSRFINDISSSIIEEEMKIPEFIKEFLPLVEKNTPCPKVKMGNHCKKPYECGYQDRCKSELPKEKITSYTLQTIH